MTAGNAIGPAFDRLRKHYPLRQEFSHYRVNTDNLGPALEQAIRALGFAEG